MALTTMWLDKNNGKVLDGELTKADRDGLEARLRGGRISFIYRPYLKDTKKRIKMTLGRYPDMSLKEAREKRTELQKLVDDGHDPRKKVAARILANANAPTLDNIFEHWWKIKAEGTASGPGKKRTYELHLKPRFGNLIYTDIDTTTMAKHIIELANKKPAIADRLLSAMRQAIKFANITGVLNNAPNMFLQFDRKSMGIKLGKGKRIFSAREIILFYRVLNACDINAKNKSILELMLFYGARGGEIRLTERAWLDWQRMTWTVPPNSHKTGHTSDKPLVRPIIKEMAHLWRNLEEFSNQKYLCVAMDSKLAAGSRLMGPGAVQDLPAQLQNYVRSNFKQEDGQPITWSHWTNHDLRRTCRTMIGNFGEWAVCEKILGHALPGEADVYDHNQYLEKMSKIYRTWWRILKELENNNRELAELIDTGKWDDALDVVNVNTDNVTYLRKVI